MKGVVFNIVEDVVCEHLGDEVWDDLLDVAEITHGHTALGNYSDQEMHSLVDAAAAALDLRPREVMVWVGARAVPYFYARYPGFFDVCDRASAFIPRLDTIIHPEVRKLDQDAAPPSFDCHVRDDGTMEVIYRSHRYLCGLAEGLMEGVGRHYGDPVCVSHPECIEHGDAQCRFDLRIASLQAGAPRV